MDDEIAAFYMTLLAQEMYQHILPLAQLIDTRGYVPEIALGTDVVEVDREKTRQLLDEIVNRFDIAVQHARYVTRKQVRILDENPAQGQIDGQTRNQTNGIFRIQFDQFHPGSDIQNMGWIDLYLPVIPHTAEHGCLETEIDDVLDKMIHQVAVIRFVNAFAHI